MLSGKSPNPSSAAGIATVNTLCSNASGYNFTQVFKYMGSTASNDLFVVGHEIGHNFGSHHTDCYPQLHGLPYPDTCYNQQAGCFAGGSACPAPATYNGVSGVTGTLMSYCHLTGCGSYLVFHPLTVDLLDDILAANNLTDPNFLTVGQNLIIPVEGYVPPTATPAEAAPLPTNPVEPPLPTATRDPNQPAPSLIIREVRGAGVLADEVLVIFSEGGAVQLAGWSVRDETGRLYQFPVLSLNQGGTITLHTAAGTDTVTDLYWGQSTPAWASGKQVLLSDSGGTLHTQFTIP